MRIRRNRTDNSTGEEQYDLRESVRAFYALLSVQLNGLRRSAPVAAALQRAPASRRRRVARRVRCPHRVNHLGIVCRMRLLLLVVIEETLAAGSP